jgi:predicted nucleic acid-binding Zn ribbon protein
MEVSHGINAVGPTECPECGGTLAKAFAAPAIHFRGSGWAKKDRKSVSGPVRKKSAAESTESSDSSAAPTDPSPAPSAGSAPSDGAGKD